MLTLFTSPASLLARPFCYHWIATCPQTLGAVATSPDIRPLGPSALRRPTVPSILKSPPKPRALLRKSKSGSRRRRLRDTKRNVVSAMKGTRASLARVGGSSKPVPNPQRPRGVTWNESVVMHVVPRWHRWNIHVQFDDSSTKMDVVPRYLEPTHCNRLNLPRTPFFRSSPASVAAAASQDGVPKGEGTVSWCRYSWAVVGCPVLKKFFSSFPRLVPEY